MGKKRALITGSSRGIGKAIAVALAKDGFHVLVLFLCGNDVGKTESDRRARIERERIRFRNVFQRRVICFKKRLVHFDGRNGSAVVGDGYVYLDLAADDARLQIRTYHILYLHICAGNTREHFKISVVDAFYLNGHVASVGHEPCFAVTGHTFYHIFFPFGDVFGQRSLCLFLLCIRPCAGIIFYIILYHIKTRCQGERQKML